MFSICFFNFGDLRKITCMFSRYLVKILSQVVSLPLIVSWQLIRSSVYTKEPSPPLPTAKVLPFILSHELS